MRNDFNNSSYPYQYTPRIGTSMKTNFITFQNDGDCFKILGTCWENDQLCCCARLTHLVLHKYFDRIVYMRIGGYTYNQIHIQSISNKIEILILEIGRYTST